MLFGDARAFLVGCRLRERGLFDSEKRTHLITAGADYSDDCGNQQERQTSRENE